MTAITPTAQVGTTYEFDLPSAQHLSSLSFKPARVPVWARVQYHDGTTWQAAGLGLPIAGTFGAPSKPANVPKSLLLHYISSWPLAQPGTPTVNTQQPAAWAAATRPLPWNGFLPFSAPKSASAGATWSGTIVGNNIALGIWQ